MTFLAPAQTAEARATVTFFGRRSARALPRPLVGGEDGARRALASDPGHAAGFSSHGSIEHLARIALG